MTTKDTQYLAIDQSFRLSFGPRPEFNREVLEDCNLQQGQRIQRRFSGLEFEFDREVEPPDRTQGDTIFQVHDEDLEDGRPPTGHVEGLDTRDVGGFSIGGYA